jgi:hypothetical protein
MDTPVTLRDRARGLVDLLVALGVAIAVAVGGLALVAGLAGAQQPTQPQASSASLTALGASARAAVEQLVDSARLSGLPVQPLYDKAAEGIFKHAPDDRIVSAVRTLLRAFGDARDALGVGATDDEIVAGASALRAGVRPDALRALRAAHADGPAATRNARRPIAVALIVLTDLVAHGVPAASATQSVSSLITRGVADRDLLAYGRVVSDDIRAGLAPATAAETRMRTIVP